MSTSELIRRAVKGSACEAERLYVTLEDANNLVKLYQTPDKELAEKIDPATFANKMEALKWRCLEATQYVIIYQFYEGDFLKHQVMIPVSPLFRDYVMLMVESSKALADYLKQDLKQVLVELVLASAHSKQKGNTENEKTATA
ncbi:Uncharacterised protein [uncultured archaeon]|nr:Uncharacterised protein [uncultured archaeon]